MGSKLEIKQKITKIKVKTKNNFLTRQILQIRQFETEISKLENFTWK